MELSLSDIFLSYRQRFDIEHFFRFGKTRLLMNKIQTPDVRHEEAWWQLVMIGTPAQPPKVRKNALGRQVGDIQVKRIRHPIVKKRKNTAFTEKMIA